MKSHQVSNGLAYISSSQILIYQLPLTSSAPSAGACQLWRCACGGRGAQSLSLSHEDTHTHTHTAIMTHKHKRVVVIE